VARIGAFMLALGLCGPAVPAAPEVVAKIQVGVNTRGIGVNPLNDRVFVANSGDHSVSVVDGRLNAVIETLATTPEAYIPHEIDVNAITNQAYVACSDQSVLKIDGFVNTIVAAIRTGTNTSDVAVNPVSNRIYAVHSFFESKLLVIDGETGEITDSVALPRIRTSRRIAVNPITNRVYLSRPSDTETDVISVYDGDSHSLITKIQAPGPIGEITADPITGRIYASTFRGRGNPYYGITVIEGESSAVVDFIRLDSTSVGNVTVNSLADRLYVGLGREGVAVIDGTTHDVLHVVRIGPSTLDTAVNPLTGLVYASQPAEGTLTVIADPRPFDPRLMLAGQVYDLLSRLVTRGAGEDGPIEHLRDAALALEGPDPTGSAAAVHALLEFVRALETGPRLPGSEDEELIEGAKKIILQVAGY
jgi:DNA-binding beta-propeller fold protein YncE